MAGMNFKLEWNDEELQKMMSSLRHIYPELSARMLGRIGRRGKQLLFDNFLSGQELKYKNSNMKAGKKRTVKYTVGKRATEVKITSFPLNFFERGREYETWKDPARNILKKKFKSFLNGKISGIVKEFDKEIAQEMANKL